MGERAGRSAVRDLIGLLRAAPGTLDGAVEAVRGYAPLIAALPEPEVRRHVAALLNVAAAAFTGTAELGEGAKAADELAVDQVLNGVPLAALLDGFQAGRVYAMSQLIDAARDAGATDAVLSALVELDTYSHELRNRLIDAYRSKEAELAQSGYAARARVLRALLQGTATDPAPLERGRLQHCLIADLTDASRAAPLEAAVAAVGGITGFVDGYLCGVTPRLPTGRLAAGALVVASPPVPVAGLPAAHRACAAALASARSRGLDGLRPATSLAVAAAVDTHPELGSLLADTLLARLERTEEFHRLLAETALAYLGHGRRTDATAIALHVHPNTVKHRLRRLAELTEFDAPPAPEDTLGNTVRWWWALHSWIDEA